MSKQKIKDYYEAWKVVRSEDAVVKLKLDIDWFELATSIVFVMAAYRLFLK